MPFTPYHFGPGFLFGFIFFWTLDLFTFLIASVIVDLEPLIVIFFNLNYPLHGFFHSFLGGSLIALPLGLLMYKIKPYFNPILEVFKLGQEIKLYKVLLAAFTGIYLHIFLDSFLYTDIQPFFPLQINPMYNLVSSNGIHNLCEWFFLMAILLYIGFLGYLLIRNYVKSERKKDSEKNNVTRQLN